MIFIAMAWLLGWYAALGFSVWALWVNGHPAWAVFFALAGVLTVHPDGDVE